MKPHDLKIGQSSEDDVHILSHESSSLAMFVGQWGEGVASMAVLGAEQFEI